MEDITELLTKDIDLETLEIEDGKIKDWDNIVNPIKEKYPNFIKQEGVKGIGSVQYPHNQQTENNDNPLANALGKYL